MRILIAGIFLVSVLILEVGAQADCRYGLSFVVSDEAGKSLENAQIEIIGDSLGVKLPPYIRLVRTDNTYLFTSHAGQTVGGDFKAVISAHGFEKRELRVNFPVCEIREFDVSLQPIVIEKNKSVLSGSVYDANGALIVGARVKAVSEEGKTFEAVTNGSGVYEMSLPFNLYDSNVGNRYRISRYDLTVESDHFRKFELKNFAFAPSFTGKMLLDLALDVGDFYNCGVAGLGCLDRELVPVESPEMKILDKITKMPLEKLPKAKNNNRKINK